MRFPATVLAVGLLAVSASAFGQCPGGVCYPSGSMSRAGFFQPLPVYNPAPVFPRIAQARATLQTARAINQAAPTAACQCDPCLCVNCNCGPVSAGVYSTVPMLASSAAPVVMATTPAPVVSSYYVAAPPVAPVSYMTVASSPVAYASPRVVYASSPVTFTYSAASARRVGPIRRVFGRLLFSRRSCR